MGYYSVAVATKSSGIKSMADIYKLYKFKRIKWFKRIKRIKWFLSVAAFDYSLRVNH